MGQIDISTLPNGEMRSLLPENGILYFFYDAAFFTRGFQSSEVKNCVHYLPGPTSGWVEAALPDDMPETKSEAGGKTFGKCAVSPQTVQQFPEGSERVHYDRHLDFKYASHTQEERMLDQLWQQTASELGKAEYERIFLGTEKHPKHWMGGYPSNIQDAGLEYGTSDVLLMEFGREESIGWLWGEAAAFQYWIRPEDLAKGNFEKTVLTIEGS